MYSPASPSPLTPTQLLSRRRPSTTTISPAHTRIASAAPRSRPHHVLEASQAREHGALRARARRALGVVALSREQVQRGERQPAVPPRQLPHHLPQRARASGGVSDEYGVRDAVCPISTG